MQYLLLCATILLPGSLAFPAFFPLERWSNTDLQNVTVYLDKFFPIFTRTQNRSLEERIKGMQRFFNLNVTGLLDSETLEILRLPRCGLPDMPGPRTPLGSPKWRKTRLTYKILNYTPDLPRRKVDNAIERAFAVWGDVTPLEFRRVYIRPADIVILFARRAHGDGNPFDGRGNVLAHAYGPGEGIGGDAHFDEDEKWSEYDKEINLFLVAAHEFGHSLGLDHSNVRGALMYPIYEYTDPETFELPEDDKQRIQELYGKFIMRF
ncbi:MMP12 metalloelastase, partial [Uria aalge]|nr:MMP12 metalloelastase [Uria aalge]